MHPFLFMILSSTTKMEEVEADITLLDFSLKKTDNLTGNYHLTSC